MRFCGGHKKSRLRAYKSRRERNEKNENMQFIWNDKNQREWNECVKKTLKKKWIHTYCFERSSAAWRKLKIGQRQATDEIQLTRSESHTQYAECSGEKRNKFKMLNLNELFWTRLSCVCLCLGADV